MVPAALLLATCPAAADVLPMNWQLGDRATLVTELQGAAEASVADQGDELDRQFGGDALRIRYSLNLGKWYARANYGRTDDIIRAGTEFQRQVGQDRTEVVLGRSWRGHSGDWWSTKTLRAAWEVKHSTDGQKLVDRYVTEVGINGSRKTRVNLRYLSGTEFQAGQLFDVSHVVLSGRLQPARNLELGFETHLRSHEDVDTNGGQRLVDGRLLDARVSWALSEAGKVHVNVQQQDIRRNPDAYLDAAVERTVDVGHKLTYSWQMNPRTEIRLGFADEYLENYAAEILGSTGRRWFMNVGYSLSL